MAYGSTESCNERGKGMRQAVPVSVGIVTYNDREKAVRAVRSLIEHCTFDTVTVTVYDNDSSDHTAEALADLGVTVVPTGGNLGFGRAHNLALGRPMGRYHAVVNPDVQVDSDVLARLIDVMEEHPEIAMITPRILNADGTVQHLPKRQPTWRYLLLGRLSSFGGPFAKVRREYTRQDECLTGLCPIEFCTGCFFVIRSELFHRLSGFDERYFMYMEDADLSRRVLEFGSIMYDGDVTVTHLWERESSKKLRYLWIHLRSCFQYFKIWGKH